MKEFNVYPIKGGSVTVKAAKANCNGEVVTLIDEGGNAVAIFNLDQIVAVIESTAKLS